MIFVATHLYEQEAMRLYRAKLAKELDRRGFRGFEEPIYWQGEVVGYVRKYDSKLALAHIRRHDPRYRENVKIDQTTVAATLPLEDLGKLSKESREDLRRILEREKDSFEGSEADSPEDS